MKKYEECLTKEEVITSFLASKKSSDDHIQASERLSQLGHHDDALKLYFVGAQMNLIERESHMIRDLESFSSAQRTAGVLMKEASEDMQSAADINAKSAETMNQASIRINNAATTIVEGSIRIGNAAETINTASFRMANR